MSKRIEDKDSLLGKEEQHGCCYPGRLPFKFLMLTIIAMICLGSYFSYDSIQPLENTFTNSSAKGYLEINKQDYGLLYSVYSIPNTVLVFFGGMVGDRIGLRLSALIFAAFVLGGTSLVALGPTILHGRQAWMLMMGGRVLLGIGGESLNVIQTAMTAVWFEDTTFLATAFGLTLAVSRLGDFLAVSTGGLIASYFKDYVYTLWAAAILTGVSFVAVIVYGIVDKYSETIVPKKAREEEKINIFAVLKFDVRFWLISLVTMLYYSGVTPFLANASDFLIQKFGYSQDNAGLVSSLIILASMVLSPILGKIVDSIGKRPYFVLFGSIAILPAHAVLGLTKFTPIVSIIIIGLSFSLVPAALWPSLPQIIEEENIATAYGMMTAIQNAGLALVNYIIGVIHVETKTYDWVMVFLIAMDVLSIALAQVLVYVDHHKGRQLCAVRNKKKEGEDVAVYDPSINPSASDAYGAPDKQ